MIAHLYFFLRIAFLAPGVALHEFAHHLFCIITGVKVHRVVYFRLGSPAGFVIHEEPELYRQIFAVVAGPVFLNSTVAIVLLNLSLRQAVQADDLPGYALVAAGVWLGLSAALQALPSRADAVNLFRSSNSHLFRANPAALLGYPVALAIFLIQSAKPLGSEWYYALGMAYLALQGFVAGPGA